MPQTVRYHPYSALGGVAPTMRAIMARQRAEQLAAEALQRKVEQEAFEREQDLATRTYQQGVLQNQRDTLAANIAAREAQRLADAEQRRRQDEFYASLEGGVTPAAAPDAGLRPQSPSSRVGMGASTFGAAPTAAPEAAATLPVATRQPSLLDGLTPQQIAVLRLEARAKRAGLDISIPQPQREPEETWTPRDTYDEQGKLHLMEYSNRGNWREPTLPGGMTVGAKPEKGPAPERPTYTIKEGTDAEGNAVLYRINNQTNTSERVQLPPGVSPGSPEPEHTPAAIKKELQQLDALKGLATEVLNLGEKTNWSGIGGRASGLTGSEREYLATNWNVGSPESSQLRAKYNNLRGSISALKAGLTLTPTELLMMQSYMGSVDDERVPIKIKSMIEYINLKQKVATSKGTVDWPAFFAAQQAREAATTSASPNVGGFIVTKK